MRWLCAFALAAVCGLWSLPGRAIPVTVKGQAAISAALLPAPAGQMLVGQLTDDAGESVSGEVRVEAPRTATIAGCEEGGASHRGASVFLRVGPDRTFCALISGVALGESLRLSYAGSSSLSAFSTTVAAGSNALPKTPLLIDAPPRLELNDLGGPVSLSMRIVAPSFAYWVAPPLSGLELTLETKLGRRLSRAQSNLTHDVTFVIPPSEIPDEQQTEVRAVFAGTETLSSAQTSITIAWSHAVALSVPAPPSFRWWKDAHVLDVDALSRLGPLLSGWLTLTTSDGRTMTARVHEGRASFEIDAANQPATHIQVSTESPPGPHLLAAQPLIRTLTAPAWAFPLRRAFLVAALMTITVLGAIGLRPPRARAPSSSPVEGPHVPAPVKFTPVRRFARDDRVIGCVMDAHDGTPVVGAVVELRRASFSASGDVRVLRTDERGEFSFEQVRAFPVEILVRAEPYASGRTSLNGPGMLVMRLTLRRRAILEGLLIWARRNAAWVGGSSHPTPELVRAIAARAGATNISEWSHAVELAAYSQAEPSEQVAELLRDGPPSPRDPVSPP